MPEFDWWSCPAASSQAFVAVIAQKDHPEGFPYQIGIATWGEGGYNPTDEFHPTLEAAQVAARVKNANLGLTETEALSIKTSSIRAPGGRVRR